MLRDSLEQIFSLFLVSAKIDIATPILYIIRLSTLKILAVFTADPNAIPRSNALRRQLEEI